MSQLAILVTSLINIHLYGCCLEHYQLAFLFRLSVECLCHLSSTCCIETHHGDRGVFQHSRWDLKHIHMWLLVSLTTKVLKVTCYF